MAKSVLIGADGEEYKRLSADLRKAQELAHSLSHKMDSPEFAQADAEVGRIKRRIAQLTGEAS